MRGAHKNNPLKMAEEQKHVSEEYGGIEENVNREHSFPFSFCVLRRRKYDKWKTHMFNLNLQSIYLKI